MRADKQPSLLIVFLKACALGLGILFLFVIVLFISFGDSVYTIVPLVFGGVAIIAGNIIGVLLARRRRSFLSNDPPREGPQ